MRINGVGRDLPMGLVPVTLVRIGYFYKDADADTIYQFAPVVKEADGGICPASIGDSNYIFGVALKYSLTGTADWIPVVYDQAAEYEIQGDDADSVPDLADVGAVANLVSTHTPNLHTSALELDVSSINATTATSQLLILGKNHSDDWGAYTRYRVRINYSQFLDTNGI